MKRVTRRLFLLIGTAVLLLLMAEIVVRMTLGARLEPQLNQPEAGKLFYGAKMLESTGTGGLHFRGRPGASVVINDISYEHNSQGLRDDELADDNGAIRILLLGDSNSYGWGVAEDDTFASKLEEMLSAAPDVERHVEVVNAGVPGFNTADQIAMLDHLSDRVNPDIVLLAWYLNDMERLGFHVDGEGSLFCDPLPTPNSWKPTLWGSHVYRAIATAVRKSMETSGDYVLGQGENRAWSEEQLLRLSAEADRLKVPLLVVDIPWLESPDKTMREASYVGAELSSWIDDLTEREKIAYLPLMPSIEGEEAIRLWASPERKDHHPNARAHSLFARAIADFILENGLLPPH